MNPYVSDIVESYKDTIISHLVDSGTSDLLLQILKCWCEFVGDEYNWYLPAVIYCSGMFYKYYSCLSFLPIKHNEEGKYIHKEVLNNIPNSIKNHFHFNSLLIMYWD